MEAFSHHRQIASSPGEQHITQRAPVPADAPSCRLTRAYANCCFVPPPSPSQITSKIQQSPSYSVKEKSTEIKLKVTLEALLLLDLYKLGITTFKEPWLQQILSSDLTVIWCFGLITLKAVSVEACSQKKCFHKVKLWEQGGAINSNRGEGGDDHVLPVQMRGLGKHRTDFAVQTCNQSRF